jgi:hypothetical protein
VGNAQEVQDELPQIPQLPGHLYGHDIHSPRDAAPFSASAEDSHRSFSTYVSVGEGVAWMGTDICDDDSSRCFSMGSGGGLGESSAETCLYPPCFS